MKRDNQQNNQGKEPIHFNDQSNHSKRRNNAQNNKKKDIAIRSALLMLICGFVIALIVLGVVFIIKQLDDHVTPADIFNRVTINVITKNAKRKVAPFNPAVNPEIPCGSGTQSNEKVVYLTFDDGPSALTKPILDVLDKYNAKATFFVTAQFPDYLDVIKTEHERGHTVGLHTYSHNYNTLYASEEAYFKDLDQIGQKVKEQIGYVPCFIRFPGGSSNAVSANYKKGLMSVLVQSVQKRGYQYYDWNALSRDGENVKDPAKLTENAVNCGDNNVVLLMHDAPDKKGTLEALPKIIETYKNRGYVFKGLNRKSYTAHHNVNN